MDVESKCYLFKIIIFFVFQDDKENNIENEFIIKFNLVDIIVL